MPRPTPFLIVPTADFLNKNPHLPAQARQLATLYAEHRVVTDDDLQAVGSALWNALGFGDELNAAKSAAGQQALPIIIETGDPAILSLPWETLYHPDFGFLGREEEFALSRRIASLKTSLPDTETGPLKILLFTSLPDDLDESGRLDVEAEQAAVQEALGVLEQNGQVCLEMPDDGRFETFNSALRTFKPHLVYLSGHGEFKQEPHRNHARGSFLFEGEWGEAVAVADREIADCFSQTQVQVLVFSACQSGKQSSAELCNGLAQTLAHRGIPQVIGMRESILDAAGIQFARAFFSAIGERQSVDCALQRARAAITRPLQGAVYRDSTDPVKNGISLGQWCLPMLLSQDIGKPPVDWRFEAKPRTAAGFNRTLGAVSLPARFIGRRRELRLWQNRLRLGQLKNLLITGAGGIGKTALAGKLIETLTKLGYETYIYSARPENRWDDFLFDLELALTKDNAERYDRGKARCVDEAARARLLLGLLMSQHQQRVALFFDNLETVQDPHSLELTDTNLAVWIAEARRFGDQGLRLLLTSRWKLPSWEDQEHYPLGKPVYGDFIAHARQQQLPRAFLENHERLRLAYRTLGGNFRGLVFFAEAVANMDLSEEQTFLEKLAKAEDEAQTDMALATVIKQRTETERDLLQRLLAFQTPVPFDGIKALALPDLSDPRAVLGGLVDVSLVEQFRNSAYQTTDYLLSPLVRDWLQQSGSPPPDAALLATAARFQLWLLENERGSFDQALAAHASLLQAGQQEAAQRLTLDRIVGPLNRAGLYRVLLNDWLVPLREADNLRIRGEALGQVGKQYHHLGDYDTALDYLKQSLAIQQQIGDKAGEGVTLNNISQIFKARGDYATALDYLKQSLAIRQQIGDKAGEGATLNNISQIYHANGDYATALTYLKQSLAIQQQIGDKAGEGVTLNNISQIYAARGDYATALDYLKQSLAIQQQIGDKAGEGATLNNISQIYDARGDYATALDYLKQSLAIRQQIGDKAGIGATLNNISQIYDARGDYATALDYLKQSLAIQQQIGDKAGEGATLNNISQIYDARGDYATALDYLKQSLAIRQQIGDSAGLCATLFNMGHIHWQNEEVENALQAWLTVYAIAKHIGLAQALAALATLADQLGLDGGLQAWEALAQRMENGREP